MASSSFRLDVPDLWGRRHKAGGGERGRLGDRSRNRPAPRSQTSLCGNATMGGVWPRGPRRGGPGSGAGLEAGRPGCQGRLTPARLPGQRPHSAPLGAVSHPGPRHWEHGFLRLWEDPFLPPPSAFLAGEASMERFLAQLCETSVSQPLPVWEGDTTGHCFTQLVLSALPHMLLAVLSACHWGTPRWVEAGARHLSMCTCRPQPKPTFPR